MTKRHLILTLALSTLPFAVIGCGGDESKAETSTATATAASTTAAAPDLPADVQDIANATAAATETSATAAAESNTFSATGEFVSPVRSELSARIPGRVAKMYVDEGSRVRRGQPVLELETEYSRLNLQAANAEVARAKAALDEAGRDLERKRGLSAKDSIPRATLDRSQAMFDQANAAHQAASAQAALLRQQIADATLRSPVDGIVAEKRVDIGARLGDGGVAFVVVQTSPLKLRFAVPERYLGRITAGDQVTARVDPYPNEAFTGVVKTMGGVIDPKTRTMFAEAEFANRDGRLRPGLFARVETKLD
ncbi:MAG TPA: efflux RND transporter periplasmic adaptor subunit [Thermoanaerobaculia bacterium]|nr:efflux RND transporter periplasmic adaptor subunit [Thermoanaerobaculia bacterium]